MFESLRNFLDEMTGGVQPADTFADDDYRVAAVALLVHLANADGVVAEAERQRLRQLVQTRYALNPADTARLIARASEDEREAIDLFHFTRVLKRRLDDVGRQAVIESLWEMAYADGKVDELEESIISRVAELLGVSPRERVGLRQRVEREGADNAIESGPWGAQGSVA